jgi:hypothetical protein
MSKQISSTQKIQEKSVSREIFQVLSRLGQQDCSNWRKGVEIRSSASGGSDPVTSKRMATSLHPYVVAVGTLTSNEDSDLFLLG